MLSPEKGGPFSSCNIRILRSQRTFQLSGAFPGGTGKAKTFAIRRQGAEGCGRTGLSDRRPDNLFCRNQTGSGSVEEQKQGGDKQQFSGSFNLTGRGRQNGYFCLLKRLTGLLAVCHIPEGRRRQGKSQTEQGPEQFGQTEDQAEVCRQSSQKIQVEG